MAKIRDYRTPKDLIDKVKILAKDNGKTMTDFLRPVIIAISEKYPNTETVKSETAQLEMTGVPDSALERISKRALQIGITENQLIRYELFLFMENQSGFNKKLF